MSNGSLSALSIKRAHAKGAPVTLGDGGGLYFRKQTADGGQLDASLSIRRQAPLASITKQEGGKEALG